MFILVHLSHQETRVALQELELVGPQLDLRHPLDRCKFLLSWVQVYRLLTVMSERLAPLQGHIALWEVVHLGSGRCRCGSPD